MLHTLCSQVVPINNNAANNEYSTMFCLGEDCLYFVHTAQDTTRLASYGGHWRPLHVAIT